MTREKQKDTTKISRNAPCPCGSGKKYKRCCLGKTTAKPTTDLQYAKKHRIHIKTPQQIEGIRQAGKLVIETLDLVESHIRQDSPPKRSIPSFTILPFRMERFPHRSTIAGFPKSVCVSINEVICHGIPGNQTLKDGDIVNVDVTPILNGYYADANKTFFVGTPSADARKIVAVALESLARGMAMVKPGNTVGDIGYAIQRYAEGQGCSVVREFVGHGVGIDFHEAPPNSPLWGARSRYSTSTGYGFSPLSP